MKNQLILIFALLSMNVSFGQCTFPVSANASTGMMTGDMINQGVHHLCFNSYADYYGNSYDTIYLENQVTLTVLWSDHLVIYADTGANVIWAGGGNNMLDAVYYDPSVTNIDTTNLAIQSITTCTGFAFDYSQMATIPGFACTMDNTADQATLEQTLPTISPNPVSDQFTIQVEQNEVLHIYTVSGQMILSKALHAGSNLINVDQLTSGVYFYQIGNSRLSKILVE